MICESGFLITHPILHVYTRIFSAAGIHVPSTNGNRSKSPNLLYAILVLIACAYIKGSDQPVLMHGLV